MSTLRRPLPSSCTPRAASPSPSRSRHQGRERRRVPLSGLGHAALLLVGLYLLGVAAQWLHGDDVDVSGKRHRRMQWGKPTSDPASTNDAYFLPLWAHHVTTHPVHARDRSGFAEMGLRTRMYASLLEHPRLRNFDYFEQILWPFLPGIKTLRQTFVGPLKRGRTRGIVMSLGSRDFEYAVHFLSTLRSVYHSSLPVEVYYYGDEDLAPNLRAYLTATFAHVRTVDLEQLCFFDADQVQLRGQGYALKTFALVATNLTDVILADADAVFLTPPESLFEQPGYGATGTLFFHDRDHIREGASTTIRTFLEAQLGAREPSAQLRGSAFWQKRGIYEQESGVVVVDKSRPAVFSALLFTAWMVRLHRDTVMASL